MLKRLFYFFLEEYTFLIDHFFSSLFFFFLFLILILRFKWQDVGDNVFRELL